jgi:hypothetical protein
MKATISLTMLFTVGAACSILPACGTSEVRRARADRAVEVGRVAILASREGRHDEAAHGFATLWREACGTEGPASESNGTYVLAQHRELREVFRSEEGRPIARALLDELAARASGPEAETNASAGFARLAAILGEPGVVADAIEARERAGLGMSTVRPVIGILLDSGREDLASKVEPSAARRAAEGMAQGLATAGLVVVTAPVSIPLALIATSGPTDFEVCNPAWKDPVRPGDE